MNINFSIIIPIHKPNYDYLIGCFNSIITQLNDNDEVICILNGNNYGCNETIKSLIPSSFKTITCAEADVSKARNIGIISAKNEHLVFIDCDDIIGHEMLEKARTIILKSNPDYITFLDTNNINELGKVSSTIQQIDKETFLKVWQGKANESKQFFQFRSCWNHIYKRSILLTKQIRFKENQKIAEDTLFNFEYTLNSENFFVDNSIMYFYRQNEEGSSVIYKKEAIDVINTTIINYINLLKKYDLPYPYLLHLYNEIIFNYLPYIFRCYLFHKDSNLSFNKRKKELKHYCKNEVIQKAVNTIKANNIKNKKHRLFLMMLKCKMYGLICLIYRKR